MLEHPKQDTIIVEKLITVKQAAAVLGVEYRQLLVGVASGAVPSYSIAKSRKMVKPSEVLASMRNNIATKEDTNV